MQIVPKYLKTHTASDNSTDYTPVWTDLTFNHNVDGSIGSMSPLWFGIHNYSAAQDVTIWTVDQGTDGSGVTAHILKGETFYAKIAKITVSNPVTLLGTTNIPGVV